MTAFLSSVTVLMLMLLGTVVLFIVWHEAADILKPWWERKKILQSRKRLSIVKR